MARATFIPAVTVIEQPDGSLIAEVDWTASITHAEDDNGVEVDHEGPEGSRIAAALDRFLGKRPGFRGFMIPPEEAVVQQDPQPNHAAFAARAKKSD